MDLTLSAVVFSLFASLLTLCYILRSWTPYANKNIESPQKLPEAEGAWPIIGHFHLFCGKKLPHVLLGSMAEKYGPIFAIKLGTQKALVVSDWKVAKDCYSSNDKVFLNRPKSIGVEVMAYNYAMSGLGPYGPYWQKMRKITRQLLSVNQIEMSEHLRISEIKESMEDIYDFWLKNKSCQNQMVGSFVLRDYVSVLRRLDWGGYEKAMRKAAKETDCILRGWLQEHKQRRKLKDEHHDIMDMLLSRIDGATSQDFEGFEPDAVVKATSLAYISGAADSTRVTLTWALSLLISNPDVLKKARDELSHHVGRNRQVEESDIKNLVYLQAIFKESMRLYPASLLLPPRESLEDCVVSGYNVPKHTRLIVNVSKIHRDPQVWPNPDEFRPERFLTSHQNVDVKGNQYELLPFGSGRRRCPGMFLGLRLVQLALASLIHGFEFEKADDEPDDMSATAGLTNSITQCNILLKPIISVK
ncbi:hypothetical protein AgCh_025496 [Apium graveolens]